MFGDVTMEYPRAPPRMLHTHVRAVSDHAKREAGVQEKFRRLSDRSGGQCRIFKLGVW